MKEIMDENLIENCNRGTVACPQSETFRSFFNTKEECESLAGQGIDELLEEEISNLEEMMSQICENCAFKKPDALENTIEVLTDIRGGSHFLPRVITVKRLFQIAREHGLEVINGNGNGEPFKICAGRCSIPVPGHSGDISPGVARKCLKFIVTHSLRRIDEKLVSV